MDKNSVRNLYALDHAQWYDPFKRIWNRLVAVQAEEDFTLFLKKNLNKNKTILELGCGTALNLEKIFNLNLKFKRYLGLDVSSDMLAIAKAKFPDNRKIEFQQKDITQLGKTGKKFDIIICTWVLSHLDAPAQVVNNMQRLLSPSGKMFFVFFSKPKWYINLWLYPLARYLFKAKPLTEDEINKFKNVRTKHKFSGDITTTMIIHR